MQDVLQFAERKSAERLDKQQEGDGEMVNLHHHPPGRHKIEGALTATLTGVQYKCYTER